MEHILKLKHLKFKYPDYPGVNFPELFSDINLNLKKGDFRVILGKPESGKTTLSRIITGLIPRYTGGKLSGEVYIKGGIISGLKPYELIEHVGCVFQNPDEQIITTRCDSEIAFPMESLGWDRNRIKKRLDTAFKITGMTPMKKRNPATLSGGEKKKLLLASLFALDPDLWILDETLEELDPASLDMILKQITRRKKTILLFASKMMNSLSDYEIDYSLLSGGRIFHKKEMSENEFQNMMEKEGLILTEFRNNISSGPEQFDNKLINIRNLHYTYRNNNTFSLRIDSLDVFEGEIISIVGRNGSGKSTLGKILSGLLKPESGEIFIKDNNNLKTADEKILNRSAGFIFQNPDYQIFLSTVKEELSYGITLSREEIKNTITLFSLPGEDTPPAIMSYGARKRLQGAVYYLLSKNLYIIDEADSGLSVFDFSRLITLLNRNNTSVIIITHNMELSSLYSKRICIMEKGKIIQTIKNNDFAKVQTYFDSAEQF